jgi:hypothetical protein
MWGYKQNLDNSRIIPAKRKPAGLIHLQFMRADDCPACYFIRVINLLQVDDDIHDLTEEKLQL